ncbi:MAG: helix-turn-helix domain-containing protein, partial [Myxococcota bacterium]
KFFTAAGVTAGIDLTLALIEEDFGTRLAGEVARQLVVHLRRSGDQRQYSSFLAAQVASDDTLDGLVEWIADNLDQDLSAFVLAERVNLGERQFRRRFTSLFGETPVRYVTRVRLEAARHLLLTTRQDIAVIAESVGYAHADSFRRAFERHFSIAPSEYRQRFAPARRTSRRAIIAGAAAVLGGACVAGRQRRERAGDYVCRPCGCADDGKAFAEPGACPSCGMLLEPAAPLFEPDRLPIGASAFFTRGYRGTTIRVHTFVPEGLRPNSRVLIVLPGAGRNGAQYRDHWATLAASASIVIAALTYPERDYDFAAYHMGGVIQDLNFQHVTELPPNQIRLREEDISFSINRDPSRWMFVDFDRVHRLVARATAAENPRYDLFGHSAGAQILHRAALLGSMGRADRIIAANAGFYTMPSDHHPLPFGLNGLAVDDARLRRAFGRSLILLLGEADNESETRGTFLRTPTADAQGLGRFARGEQFYRAAEAEARRLNIPLTWRKVSVAGVGHDFRQMSDAAELHRRAVALVPRVQTLVE